MLPQVCAPTGAAGSVTTHEGRHRAVATLGLPGCNSSKELRRAEHWASAKQRGNSLPEGKAESTALLLQVGNMGKSREHFPTFLIVPNHGKFTPVFGPHIRTGVRQSWSCSTLSAVVVSHMRQR